VPLWNGASEMTAAGAWRYMLDYEVNPEGDSIAYFYNTQNNYYATDGGTTANGQYTSPRSTTPTRPPGRTHRPT
jgi:hypothetical protein